MRKCKLTPMSFMRKYMRHEPNFQAHGRFGYRYPLNVRNPIYADAEVVKGREVKSHSDPGIA